MGKEDGFAASLTFAADVQSDGIPEAVNTGIAATRADVKGHFAVSADAALNSEKNCFQIGITQANLTFDEVSVHNMSFTIENGTLVNLNQIIKTTLDQLTGDQVKGMLNQATPQVLDLLMAVDLPCIKNPFGVVQMVV